MTEYSVNYINYILRKINSILNTITLKISNVVDEEDIRNDIITKVLDIRGIVNEDELDNRIYDIVDEVVAKYNCINTFEIATPHATIVAKIRKHKQDDMKDKALFNMIMDAASNISYLHKYIIEEYILNQNKEKACDDLNISDEQLNAITEVIINDVKRYCNKLL